MARRYRLIQVGDSGWFDIHGPGVRARGMFSSSLGHVEPDVSQRVIWCRDAEAVAADLEPPIHGGNV